MATATAEQALPATAIVADRQARGGVLVLGGGFAGAYVARLVGERGATLVDPHNFMLYTPSLPECASGTLSPPNVVVPLRQMCPHAELIVGRVTGLDEEAQTAEVDAPAGRFRVRYDHLVVALGSITRALPIPGLTDHGLGFKTLGDAMHLRNHVLQQLEAAAAEIEHERAEARLTFVFVGAGYAGVETLTELFDLVEGTMRYYPSLRDVRRRWLLVDAAPKILPEIPPELGEYAAHLLRERGIDVRVSTTLQEAEANAVALSDGERIPTHTLVWTAGVMANPVLRDLGLPLDERGRVKVDSLLRVEGRANVWALGDCAAVPNAATPERADPPTCQHALRQARRLAKNLRGDLQPYAYKMLGQGATLGHRKGIADVFGVRVKGFVGWSVVRGYHLYQLPLVNRKLRVVLAWAVTPLLHREIAELGEIGHPQPLGS